MTTSKIIGSDLMLDLDRDEVQMKSYTATIPLRMKVHIDSENELGLDEIIERLGDIISNLCECAYKTKQLSEIENISIDMDTKWDVVVG